ncbi:acyclic terpene utilization AtuA family protein [Sphingomonas sp. TDK1]|uniref:acyclic terpene utilization AtuA family protein n=1 Tax=Sphingomonas sp. TDK1 TaxID=453247 RepID=UPI0007D9BD63|nr:acyclic terpene utilization AtuA family protein [Sphingomonas sp. TDK1]OAN62293.1 ABC transporter substrate-binding protein [Sphingomonas sp. TDK1]
MRPDTLRIGAGAGFAGDRIEPALELVEQGDLDFLVFECLAERTIAAAQQLRQSDRQGGFDPLLLERMRRVLPAARARGVRIVTNAGAANPVGAAHAVAALARDMGLRGLRIAAVTGDDVLDRIRGADRPLIDRPGTSADLVRIVSANAYLGAGPIADALAQGAEVVITGRVGDPALFVGPMVHAFGWSLDDAALMGRATVIGHLLECAGQLTGGYFGDNGRKQVPGLARLGFPFAEVAADASAVLGKVAGSGGALTLASCKEQLLYEILDPGAYPQADVIADFRSVRFAELGPDRIAVSGGDGRPRPEALKVSIGYDDGFIGEGQISYAGPGAVGRARLAAAIVEERLAIINAPVTELQSTLIGLDSVDRTGRPPAVDPREVRLRVVGRSATAEAAALIGREVEALYTNGPFGGGGATATVRPVLAVASTLIPAAQVRPAITLVEA